MRVGVLEGDVQGSMDADRLASLHVPVTQLNTDAGFGGECHLDANMVRSALGELPLDDIDLLVIENVGNLVCPAEFRVGEDARIMVSSITEGEEKPLKYPLMFRACELVLVNKIDLLPHLDFDLDRFLYNLDQVHPGVERILVSAKTGEGIDEWRDWLARVGSPWRRRPPWPLPRRPPARRRACDARAANGRRRARSERPDAREPRLLRRGGRPARARVSPDGRAVRPRRPADRVRPLAGRALGRPPRGRRVRAPGDRRKARAAGDRAGGGGREPRGPGRAAGGARRHRDRLRADEDPEEVRAALAIARERGCLTLAFAPAGAEWEFEPPSDDAPVRQELVETLYHVLWELVHVFFDHRGLLEGRSARPTHDTGASSFLYPFLSEGEHDLEAVVADVRASVLAKSRDVGELREQTLTDNRDTLIAAAEALRADLDAGGRLLALGNGGSATDAMDVVADFRRPPDPRWAPRRALDLTEDSAILTAIANDIGTEAIFARQVIAHGREGDALLAISTSGNSSNVIAALGEARSRGLRTIAMVGYDGGRVAAEGLADHVVVTRSEHIPRIQEAQASAYHVLRELVG